MTGFYEKVIKVNSKAVRRAAPIRISSCALPPVRAKPNPSIVWKRCAIVHCKHWQLTRFGGKL